MKSFKHILIAASIAVFILAPSNPMWGMSTGGINYVVLQDNKTLKSQLTQENTFYEVRYDFDMKGASMRVPDGTIMKFAGGMIKNCPSLSNLRDIEAPLYQIFENVKHVSSISVLHPEWFGAIGNGVHDDTEAIQNTINAQINYTCVYFKRGTYKTTAPIVIPQEMKYSKIYGDVSAKIRAEHNGNCFEFSPSDIEAGHIVFRDLIICGPNDDYGSFLGNKSIGAGVQLTHAYNNLIENCVISGFKYGLRITTGIGNDAIRSTFRFCEYGVYLDGEATNLNRFVTCNIRENRREGVHIEGVSGSPALQNEFSNCYVEDNIPYVKMDISKDVGIGFSITRGDFTIIKDCYLEAQYTFFNFGANATSTRIVDCRLAVPKTLEGHSVFRYSASGKTIRGNRIIRCSMQSNISSLNPSIGFTSFTNNDDYGLDLYSDCVGLTLSEQLISDKRSPRFRNEIPNIAYGGTYNRMMNVGACYQNPGFEKSEVYPYIEKTKDGNILHLNGFGHIVLGERIKEELVINQISGLNVGDVVIIEAYSLPATVIFQHKRYGLWMNNNKDVIIPSKGDMMTIVFYKDYQGQIVEMSRNF